MIEFSFETEAGAMLKVIGTGRYVRDTNFGADADGRRGVEVSYVNNIKFDCFVLDIPYPKSLLTDKDTEEIELYITEKVIREVGFVREVGFE